MSQPGRREIIRALLLTAEQPLSVKQLEQLLGPDGPVTAFEVREHLRELREEMVDTAMELIEVASGFRLQIRREFAPWIGRLWQEKPQKYSRALLETLALVCYRQPLTRGDIEDIRGVSLSGGILKTLFEREWVREIGHREGPGRPALLATTRQFLDDFNLRSLDDLPALQEIDDPEKLEAALARLSPTVADLAAESAATGAGSAEAAEHEADAAESVAAGAAQEPDEAVERGVENDSHVWG